MNTEESKSDLELVESARTGNNDSFGELVRRHRERALGWAVALTNDGYLAEDIVQEALVKAFLSLEMLIDASQFRYWLQRIVRNQANMKLRRGGLYGKEKPFTGFTSNQQHEENGSDLDRILYRLSSEPVNENQDPQAWLQRKELLSSIHYLILCLTPKEREVFEAYFFQQLSATEIAKLLGTSTGSVYTSISRSRVKVQRERIRIYFQGYVTEKKRSARKTRHILASPIPF